MSVTEEFVGCGTVFVVSNTCYSAFRFSYLLGLTFPYSCGCIICGQVRLIENL